MQVKNLLYAHNCVLALLTKVSRSAQVYIASKHKIVYD